MSKSITAVICMVAVVLFVLPVKAQERDGSRLTPAERNRSGTLRQLVPGYYVFSSTSFNSGMIATGDGVIVLDALTSEAIARKEREAIATQIKQPVRFLVSSTFHNNYTWGNVAYSDVVKIGHEDYRTDLLAQMQRDQVSPGEQQARLPQITYRDRLTIHLGGKEIQVLYLGKGHTRSDSIIFVPQDRIAYVSELYFSDQFLYINDGYGVSWLKTLDAIEALPADIFVPGHGPIPEDQKKPARASIVFARCWSICATQFKKKSTAERRKIRPSPQSSFLNTNRCRDTNPKGKSPCAARTGKSWARLSEIKRFGYWSPTSFAPLSILNGKTTPIEKRPAISKKVICLRAKDFQFRQSIAHDHTCIGTSGGIDLLAWREKLVRGSNDAEHSLAR